MAVQRVFKALNFQKPDRLPVYEWFWPEFMENWYKKYSKKTDIFELYEIDIRNVSCDISPNPKDFKILENTESYTVFRNG